MSAADVAKWANQEYMGFDASDDNSPVGVMIRMTNDPKFYCHTPCYQGHSDCLVSTSVYNHMLQLKDNHPRITMGKASGILFNSTGVHNTFGKCSYMFDGATFNRINGGCGCGAGGAADCKDPMSAYYNKDPHTKENATGTSQGVEHCYCEEKADHLEPWPITLPSQTQCFWKGPAFYPPDGKSPDQTRNMIKQRLSDTVTKGYPVDYCGGGQELDPCWNEVLLDGSIVLDAVQTDPATAIAGVVYIKGNAGGKSDAQKLAKAYKENFNMAWDVPIIAVDSNMDVTQPGIEGPFLVEAADEEGRMVV